MRYVLAVTVFSFVMIVVTRLTDKVCFDETDEEICESVHLECGVTVHIEDACGKKRNVECVCPSEMSCSLETLRCE